MNNININAIKFKGAKRLTAVPPPDRVSAVFTDQGFAFDITTPGVVSEEDHQRLVELILEKLQM